MLFRTYVCVRARIEVCAQYEITLGEIFMDVVDCLCHQKKTFIKDCYFIFHYLPSYHVKLHSTTNKQKLCVTNILECAEFDFLAVQYSYLSIYIFKLRLTSNLTP